MATITEQLKWLITANSDQAVSAFQKAGNAADKELGKAQSRIDKLGPALTKFGTGAIASSALLGGALIKASGSFEKLALSAAKFSATAGTTVQDSSKLIEVTGDIGISSDSLSTALNRMNKTLGTTPQVFDKYNVAVARTKNGNEDVMGTFLNVVDRLKEIPDPATRAAAATAILGKGWGDLSLLIAQGSDQIKDSLSKVSDAKIIDPSEAQDAKDYQAALDSLKDSAEDLALSIGKGAGPVIADLAKVIGSGVQAFDDLNNVTSGFVGRVAAIAAVVGVAGGGLAVLVGGVLKVKSTLSDAGGEIAKFATRLGVKAAAEEADAAATEASAAASTGKVAAVGAETVAVEANTVALGENATAQTTLGRLGTFGGIATGVASIGALTGEAIHATKATGELGKAMNALSTAGPDQLQEALDRVLNAELAASNPSGKVQSQAVELAQQNLDGAKKVLAAIQDGSLVVSNSSKFNAQFAKDLSTEIDKQTAAQKDNAAATDDVADAQQQINDNAAEGAGLLAGLSAATNGYVEQQQQANENAAEGAGLLAAFGEGTRQTAQEAADAAKVWAGYATALAVVENTADAAARSQGHFRDALAQVADDASGSLKANLNLDESYASLRQSFKDNGRSVDEYTDKGRKNIEAILATGDAIRNNLSQQLKDSGGDYDQVKRAAADYTDQLSDQLKQAGLTSDQIESYIQTLGLTPDQVQTAIVLTGQADAKSKLDTLNVDLDTFDGATRTAYVEAIAQGDYGLALDIIRKVTDAQNKTVTYTVTTNYKTIGDLSNSASKDFHGIATGARSASPGVHALAERGPEIVVGKDGARLVGQDGPVVANLRGGERVYNAHDTAAILRGGAGTGPGVALPGYASGTGPNITHITLPGAVVSGAGGVSTDDAVKEQDRLQAAMYETGRISLDAYRKYVVGRLAQSQDLSDDYLTQFRLLNQLSATEKSAAADSIKSQGDVQKAMFDTGAISLQSYKDYLTGRLGSYQTYSSDWKAVYDQIKSLNDQETADQKKQLDDQNTLVQAAYQQAQANKSAADALSDQSSALNDVLAAGAEGSRIQNDRHSTDADRADAVQKLVDAQTKLGETAYRTVLAQATQAGLDTGTVAWDRFVRDAVQRAIDDFGAQGLGIAAGVLAGDLTGIPALAKGGIVKASPGGTLIRAGEGGKDEAVIPLTSGFGTVIHNHITLSSLSKPSAREMSIIAEELARLQRRNGRNGLTAVS